MEEEKTYGYCELTKEGYDNLTAPSHFSEAEYPQTGYNPNDTNFICSKMAKETPDCCFVDTVKLLSYPTREEAIDYAIEQGVLNHRNLVFGCLDINTDIQHGFDYLNQLIYFLRFILPLSDENCPPLKRCVSPLTVVSLGKEAHGVALCLDADKEKKILNIMILEQHAQRQGQPDYNPKLDYSKEIEEILHHFEKKGTLGDIGYQINTFQNQSPICREKGVCGIVSAEVCRRLLQAEDPLQLAKAWDKQKEQKFTQEDVKALHQENYQAYQQEQKKCSKAKKSSSLKGWLMRHSKGAAQTANRASDKSKVHNPKKVRELRTLSNQ